MVRAAGSEHTPHQLLQSAVESFNHLGLGFVVGYKMMYIFLVEAGLKSLVLKFGSGICLQLGRSTTFLENAFKGHYQRGTWKGHRYRSVGTCILYSTDRNDVNQPRPPAIANLYLTKLLDYDESAFMQVCVGYSQVVGGANRVLACVSNHTDAPHGTVCRLPLKWMVDPLHNTCTVSVRVGLSDLGSSFSSFSSSFAFSSV